MEDGAAERLHLDQETGMAWSGMSENHEAHEEHEGGKHSFNARCSLHYSDLRVLRVLRGA